MFDETSVSLLDKVAALFSNEFGRLEINSYCSSSMSDTHPPLQVKNDLKNFLAWLAFEQVAYQLVSEIEPELV